MRSTFLFSIISRSVGILSHLLQYLYFLIEKRDLAFQSPRIASDGVTKRSLRMHFPISAFQASKCQKQGASMCQQLDRQFSSFRLSTEMHAILHFHSRFWMK
ncbi:hypothetical protein B0J14DRAFT_228845 [Halenospora varia]|nr:hypothetical protein B0J14DRAFT_228845 [Halenospora varia]